MTDESRSVVEIDALKIEVSLPQKACQFRVVTLEQASSTFVLSTDLNVNLAILCGDRETEPSKHLPTEFDVEAAVTCSVDADKNFLRQRLEDDLRNFQRLRLLTLRLFGPGPDGLDCKLPTTAVGKGLGSLISNGCCPLPVLAFNATSVGGRLLAGIRLRTVLAL